ncbi:DNA gyrase inhibitor YacG [Sphingobium cloacae]|uniref:DNA gyrase inhibitor YacG n=1 Tax=Sphingobium cloacae TaxID=120107 RepID=UPI00082C4297|nr:DNA gyrase inhibitor YacG [Sphingobium cloacae]
MSPKASSCPICGEPSRPETRPFCGERCRDRDLLQWLGEGYRVPGAPASGSGEKTDDYGVDSTPD